jgi:hypothetical protein
MVRALLIALALTAACSDKPSDAECEKLTNHLINLAVKAGGADKATTEMKADHEKQKAGLKKQTEEYALKECKENLPASQVRCALKAQTMEAVAACEEG